MTTATVNTVISHAATANFRTWAAEVIAQLLAVGLTQTADTGQINTATVNKPAINTSAGYAIFRFNDTAQGSSPIFMRIEFGTGSATTNPQMWITVGSGTNGAGTINGLALDRVSVTGDVAPVSTATPYVSRFCYNAAQGFLGMAWKLNGAAANVNLGGFFIFRSTDSAGAPTTDAALLITNSTSTGGSTGNAGYMQVISYVNATAYNAAAVPAWPLSSWGYVPFGVTATFFGSNSQVFPVFQYTPVLGISASTAMALLAEVGMGSTVTLALIGVTTHTFIQVGGAFGTSQITQQSLSTATYGMLMLWE